MGLFSWLRGQYEDYRWAYQFARRVEALRTPPASVKLPRDIATPRTLDEAVAILTGLGLRDPKRMKPVERDGPDLPAMTLTGDIPRLRAVARRLNAPWRVAGLYVFYATDGSAPSLLVGGKYPPALGVLATREHEDVIRFMGTCNWGDGEQAGLLALLRELGAAQPFDLPEVQAAALLAVFRGRVVDPDRWAERLLAVCPPREEEDEDPDAVRGRYREELAGGELSLSWDDPR